MNKAAFTLEMYSFNKVNIDFETTRSELQLHFEPSGIFKQTTSDSLYELKVIFYVTNKDNQKRVVEVECNAIFRFATRIDFCDIPSYFYGNSIAIIFPYIRAFVSTVTLQANFPPLMLPTMNLSSLAEPLREHTTKA